MCRLFMSIQLNQHQFFSSNQDVQEKLREEIFEIIGKERQPSLSDRNQMHYTQATILEIQRQVAGIAGERVFAYQ